MTTTPRMTMERSTLDDASRPEDFLERARAIRSILEDGAAEADRTGRLADAAIDAIIDTGLLKMWLPRAVGGYELGPIAMIDVIEELSYAEPAAGWVAMAAVLATTTNSAYLADDAVEELYGDGRVPVIAGQGSPRGIAEVVDGGYRLSGRWNYGSGVRHATHIYSGAVVHKDGEPVLEVDGSPKLLLTVVPREQVTFGENWDVLGLKGTGSIDYSIDDVFVSESYTHPARTRVPLRGGKLYTLGVMGMGCLLHGAWAVGVARRAFDELGVYARSAAGAAKTTKDSFLIKAGQIVGDQRASEVFLRQVWTDIEQSFDRGEGVDHHQQTMERLSVNQVTYSALRICEAVYHLSGGVGLRAGAIQRCYRDINAGTQHLIVSDLIIQDVGRDLLGIAEGAEWRHHELLYNPAGVE